MDRASALSAIEMARFGVFARAQYAAAKDCVISVVVVAGRRFDGPAIVAGFHPRLDTMFPQGPTPWNMRLLSVWL